MDANRVEKCVLIQHKGAFDNSYLLECQTPRWVTIAFHQMATGFTITANNRPEFHPMGNVGPMATISVWNKNGLRKRIITSRSGRVRTE